MTNMTLYTDIVEAVKTKYGSDCCVYDVDLSLDGTHATVGYYRDIFDLFITRPVIVDITGWPDRPISVTDIEPIYIS